MFKRLLLSFLLACSCLLMTAQTKTISVSGAVVDAKGTPLPGVIVYQSGNNSNGAVTDLDGRYTIKVPSNSTLVFSCLGYADHSIPVNGKSNILATLKEDSLSLDAAEVVSVGYGSVARRDLTGSVSKVDMDDIAKSSSLNFDQAIAGRVAGVVVSTSDGAPGSEANIVIRGNNSLTQSSAPLYVVDGFPMESSVATAISPADIESVDILKDASATAIYGARGANGVIVITTKQGVEGKPVINFSASWSGSILANKADLMNAHEFVQMHDDYSRSLNLNNIYLIEKNDKGTVYDYYKVDDYKNVRSMDWQDQIYRPAFSHNYNVSLSGGSKSSGTKYNASFSYTDQGGIIVNSNFKRYNGKVNLSQKLWKKADLTINATFSRSITDGNTPASSNSSSSSVSSYLMYSVWGYRPVKPIYLGDVSEDFANSLIDADLADSDDRRFNPAASVRNEYRKRIYDYLNANAALSYEIITGLKLRVSGGYVYTNTQNEQFNNEKTATGYPLSSLGWGVNGAIHTYKANTWLNENTINYSKTFGGAHHFKALAGITFQHQIYKYTGVKSYRMSTSSLGLNGLHTGDYQPVTPYENNWGLMSYLARINYDYKYKYYFTASFRADGSSKFPKQNRWGYFPSASVAWNFNREDWLKDVSWLNNGKLRFSWGYTGNNRTNTPWDFYSKITTEPGSTASFDYVINGQIVPGYFPSNMTNEKLKWETTEQYNLGLDLGFFDNRLTFTADAYLKNTRDLLLDATIPASSGYHVAMINVGSIRNKGLEFTINAIPVQRKNFEWSTNFNIGINRNTVVGLSQNQTALISTVSWNNTYSSQYPYITQVGMPTGMMFGYIYDGVYKPDDFVNGEILKEGVPYLSSYKRTAIKPGDPKYRDITGDGIVDDSDRTIIGCGQPLATGGWSNNFKFYGFDLAFFFNWSYGNDVLNANRLMFENYQGTHLNQFSTMKNAYHPAKNPDSDIPRVGANGMFVYSSRVVEDASYLRLKSLSLGYTFANRLTKRLHISNLRIYFSAENVFTLTNYSGADPEVSTRNSVLTPGFDWSSYPRARSFVGGISFVL